MANSIFKYRLEIIDEQQIIALPKNAKILTVQNQHDEIYFWALVSQNSSTTENKTFQIFATGGLMEQAPNIEYKYISTVQLFNGSLVYHIFECINKSDGGKK